MRNAISLLRALVLVLASIASGAEVFAQSSVPDLTKGGTKDATHDWNLGPTGARGWIYGKNLETTDARQILVTQVEKGSPADGVLQVGDVILGVGAKPFAGDARKLFGAAITEAEKTENHGLLQLQLWRKGATQKATVHLEVLGSYSDSSPENCPKTKRIIEAACKHLAQHGLGDSLVAEINALGLLATGKSEYQDEIQSLAHKLGAPTLKLELVSGMHAWDWGYTGIFLGEYYLATGDKYVLPAIREYAITMAQGQSGVGTWGHGMQLPGASSLGGYGAINQSGMGCWLALVLAQKCGVKDALVLQAIERSKRFFSFYIGKGSIPYGDHAPYYFLHDNNGKNAMAAVTFDLLDDAPAARFFSRMSTASYGERELGHTGNFFSYLWGPLGVARAGNEALAAHLAEQRWFYDLARRWDGGFTYQGGAGEEDSYEGWDTTGSFLLTYALPLKKLLLTGKGSHAALALTGAELKSVIEDGRGFDAQHLEDCYFPRKVPELLASLSSWSPTVRYRAANALALKKAEVVPQLVELLGSESLSARYGACQALERIGERAAPAVDALIGQLGEKDEWLQIRAAFALADIGKPARKAVPALLKLALAGDPKDPRQTTRRYLGIALFLGGYIDTGPRHGLLADSIEDVDPALLVSIIKELLAADDGLVRAQVASVYDKLSPEELEQLWPAITAAVSQGAPSGEMYADEIRVAGLKLLAQHQRPEGMQACVDYARHQNPWGSESRMGEIMQALVSYGAAAKPLVPQLKELAQACRDEQDFPDDCKAKKVAAVEAAITTLGAPAKKLKVFVLAGQSNMEGPAILDLDLAWDPKDYNGGKGSLAQYMRDPAKKKQYAHLLDARGQWRVRDDVFVRYQLEDGALKKGPLAPGFTPYDEHHFGPELELGHVIGDAFEEQVLLVKTAWGGKSLFVDFRPPSAGGKVGPYYTKMIAQVHEALGHLALDFPALAGSEPVLAGFVWYQGWNDGCDPEHAVPEYEQNLVHLIHDVRAEFKAPKLPVVIGEITGPWVKAEGEWDLLRKAQAGAATRPEFAGNVVFVPTHDFVRKPEDSPNPEHAHHEFGNGETYYLVGHALGEALKKLCGAR